MGGYTNNRINVDAELPALMRRINALEIVIPLFDLDLFGVFANTTPNLEMFAGGPADTFYATFIDSGTSYIGRFNRTLTELYREAYPTGAVFASFTASDSRVFMLYRVTVGMSVEKRLAIYDDELSLVDDVDLTSDLTGDTLPLVIAATSSHVFAVTSGTTFKRFTTDGTYVDEITTTGDGILSVMRSVPSGNYVYAIDAARYLGRFNDDGDLIYEVDAGATPTPPSRIGVIENGPYLYAYVTLVAGTNRGLNIGRRDLDFVDIGTDYFIDVLTGGFGNAVTFITSCVASEVDYFFISITTAGGSGAGAYIFVLHASPLSRFYRYPTTSISDRQSFGLPDGGETIPTDSSFNARSARSTFTFTGNAANNETITLDSNTYTIKSALTPAAYEVLLGGSAGATLLNIVSAMMRTGTPGVDYAADTPPHETCGATVGSGDTLIAYAYDNTSSGDSIATTDTIANGSWTASTLGGANAAGDKMRIRPNPITDMRNAIEALAEYYINADTGDPFNWTNSDPDNLYWKANGEGSDYDWTDPLTRAQDLALEEIDNCLTLLEASDPI